MLEGVLGDIDTFKIRNLKFFRHFVPCQLEEDTGKPAKLV